MNRRHGKIVEPMFLSGLSIDDTADVIQISSSMKEGELTAARVWLRAGAV